MFLVDSGLAGYGCTSKGVLGRLDEYLVPNTRLIVLRIGGANFASSMGLPFQYLSGDEHHLNAHGHREVARRLLPWLNQTWQATEGELTVTDDMVRYGMANAYQESKTGSYADARVFYPDEVD